MKKVSKPSLLRLYGFFVIISIIFLSGIVYGFLESDPMIFWAATTLFVLLGIIRILLIIRAITHKSTRLLEHEQQLSQEQDKLLAVVNSLGEAVFAVDSIGQVSLYNSAALELLDSHDDPTGKSLSQVLPLHTKDNKTTEIISSVLKEGKIITRDDVIFQSAQNPIDLYIMATPINQQGEIVGAIVLARNISRQKNLQQQKDEFLSVVSHELRTPVAIVEADVSTVLSPTYASGLEAKTMKLLKSAAQNITYLSGLLQDISDLSHSERMVLDVELHSIDVEALTKELGEEMSERAKPENLTIEVGCPPDLPKITSSEQRVREILINFLTNAIKYSAGVGKVVRLTAEPSQQFPGGIIFAVQDEGLGISQDEQKKLFHKFYRSSSEKVQAIKGTGMGLYITLQQAKKLGGTINMKSEINKGSIFYLDLPATTPSNKVTTTSSSE